MSTEKKNIPEKEEKGYKVELYLYDLSQGMAKAMSMGLLGKQIDGIWHTGVVVYGSEYFYGGGIQASSPGMTQAGSPVQRLPLGVTYITQDVFHDFLRSVADQYSPRTYNLLTNNCNNFSDAVSNFLLDRPIPKHITDLPRVALSTPMGQMFRPMLENMQNQMGGVVPWGDSPINLPIINNNPPMALPSDFRGVPIDGKESGGGGGGGAGGKEVATSSSKTKEIDEEKARKEEGKVDLKKHPHLQLKLRVVKSDAKPIMSKDGDYKRFVAIVKAHNKKLLKNAASRCLSNDEVGALESFTESFSNPAVAVPLAVTQAIIKLIMKWPGPLLFPPLGLYQAIMLRDAQRKVLVKQYKVIIPKLIAIVSEEKAKDTVQMMALCVFLNMFANSNLSTLLTSDEAFMDMLVNALESESGFVKTSAARLAFNAALSLPKDGGSDGVIQLASILPSVCMEHSTTTTKGGNLAIMLRAIGQLMFCNDEACEVVGAMDFKPSDVVSSFKGSKVLLKIQNAASDVDALLKDVTD